MSWSGLLYCASLRLVSIVVVQMRFSCGFGVWRISSNIQYAVCKFIWHLILASLVLLSYDISWLGCIYLRDLEYILHWYLLVSPREYPFIHRACHKAFALQNRLFDGNLSTFQWAQARFWHMNLVQRSFLEQVETSHQHIWKSRAEDGIQTIWLANNARVGQWRPRTVVLVSHTTIIYVCNIIPVCTKLWWIKLLYIVKSEPIILWN